MKNVNIFLFCIWTGLIIFYPFLESCGPSAREMAEKEFRDSIQNSNNGNLVFGSIGGINKFRGNEYFVVQGYYDDYLVPLSHDNQILEKLNNFSDYVKLREQHIKDSMTVVNKDIEIRMFKVRIDDLNKTIKLYDRTKVN